MSEKKRDAGYRAALTGAKGTVRLLIYVCVILVIILAAKTSYQFGHDVFAEEPVASRGKGKEVTVQVRSGMEAKELGELLKDNGLIDESRYELDDQGKRILLPNQFEYYRDSNGLLPLLANVARLYPQAAARTSIQCLTL